MFDDYPEDYRHAEVEQISRALCTGECAALIGLSGSGKSNLVGFLAHRVALPAACARLVLVDCNRLAGPTPAAVFNLLRRAVVQTSAPQADLPPEPPDEAAALDGLERAIQAGLAGGRSLALLLDRFDALFELRGFPALADNLRALRDAFKYRLCYVTAARRPLDPAAELAELFFGYTLWLGPLNRSDALWSARRDGRRFAAGGPPWPEAALERLAALSWGYPSLLRGACEAYAAGAELSERALSDHPAVARRVAEFWSDRPTEEMVRLSGLAGHPWLRAAPPPPPATGPRFDTTRLTAKEHLLLAYLLAHPNQVCEKDDLVQAIWPEDVIFQQGVRDESLAQLARRLRVKIEPDPQAPRYVQTVPGRGYLLRLDDGWEDSK